MNIEKFVLDNGMQLWVHINSDEPRIYTQITVNVGSKNDPIQKTGLAHYLEHLMFKGTTKIGALNWEEEQKFIAQIEDLYEQYNHSTTNEDRSKIYKEIDRISLLASDQYSAGEYDRLMQNLGAKSVNAATSYDYTTFIADIPKNELEKWLTIEAERFSSLVLRGFHTELETVYEEFNISQDDDSRKVFNKLMNGIFGTHPYGHHAIIGFGEDLKKPSQVQIHQFFEQYYVPENMILLMSGDINLIELVGLANNTFGKIIPKKFDEKSDLKFRINNYKAASYEVFGNESPYIMLAYPVEYTSIYDYDKLMLIKGLLYNGKSGLIDENLLNTQSVLEAQSFSYLFKEGGLIGLYGKGIENQSLEDVKDLLLAQVELLKNGDIEEWLIEAIINNFILNDTKMLETNKGWTSLMNFVFVNNLSWDFITTRYQRLKEITKNELIDFANKIFITEPIVVYKRQGEDQNVMKVEKPPITPIRLNQNLSEFGKIIGEMPVRPIQPQFVDFNKKIEFVPILDQLNLAAVKNTTIGLFELHWIIEQGLNDEPFLEAYFYYVEYCGTNNKSLQDIKNELFRYGLQINFSVSNEKTYLTLTGLESNIHNGIFIIYDWLQNLKADTNLWTTIVKQIRLQRLNDKSEKHEILRKGMVNFAKYGMNSTFISQPNSQKLLETPIVSLIDQFKNLIFKTNKIYYLGNEPSISIAKEIRKFHYIVEKIDTKSFQDEQVTKSNTVFWVDFPGVQVDALFLSIKDFKLKNIEKWEAEVFNQYFGMGLSSVVFQEIRESKAIAYSTYAQYTSATLPYRKDFFQAFLGTQPDKLIVAIQSMLDLINHYEMNINDVEKTVASFWKKIENYRIPTNKIYWQYIQNKEMGLDIEINKLFWDNRQNYHPEAIFDFKKNFVQNAPNNILLIGDKSTVNINLLNEFGTFSELKIDEIMPN